MKVLHLDSGLEWRGGQQQVLYLTQGLEELGVTSVVATPQGSPLSKQLRQRDLPVIEIPYTAPFAPKTVRAMQRILADRNWSVLHSHTAHAHTLGFLSYRLPPPRSFQRPAFVVSRRVDFVPRQDPLTRLKYTSDKQYFVCVSDAIRRILEDYGVPARSLFVVRSGVSIPELVPEAQRTGHIRKLRDDLGIPADRFLLGSIGHFVAHKGHRYLLEAVASLRAAHPTLHLVLLGNGELEDDLRGRASALQIDDAVTFAGQRPHARQFLPAFDLYVHASVEEGLGTSVLDAGAAGIPVVATRAGGLPEAVEEGRTGVLVEPANTEALAQAIADLIPDQARRLAMGCAGRTWVEAGFSEHHMVDASLSVYREILGRTSS